MEWTREKCLTLLDQYETYPVLWNPKHGMYYNKDKKVDGWVRIAQAMGCPTEEIKKKTESMLASFRRERAKGSKTVSTRKGTHNVFVSKWYAFKRMGFLLNRTKSKSALNSVNSIEDETQSDDAADPLGLEATDDDRRSPQPPPPTHEVIHYAEPSPHVVTAALQPARAHRQRQRKLSESSEDPRLGEALSMLRGVVASAPAPPDDSAVYGQHVANKLRDYGKRTRDVVQHHFNEILFHADMGRYDTGAGASYSRSHPNYDPDPDPSHTTNTNPNPNPNPNPNINSNPNSNSSLNSNANLTPIPP